MVLLHGIPSINPAEPGDTGYPGLAERFAENGWAAAWVDMRAVRGSEGYFSIEGWVRDLRATLDAVHADGRFGALRTVVVGSSAGGAVATNAVRHGAAVDGLALLAAPASWVSFAGDPPRSAPPDRGGGGHGGGPRGAHRPAGWADEFSAVTTVTAISDVRTPILIVHGTADSVVPVGHTNVLAEAAPSAELRILEGAEHQLRKEPEAVDAVLEWLERTLGVTVVVRIIVGVGILGAVLLGLGLGFDSGALVILGFIVLFGALAIAVADKARSGAVQPASCPAVRGPRSRRTRRTASTAAKFLEDLLEHRATGSRPSSWSLRGSFSSSAGYSTIATTRDDMNRPALTTTPVRVSSATSTTPRALDTSTRRPAFVATISKVFVPAPVSTSTDTRSPFMDPCSHAPSVRAGRSGSKRGKSRL